jgi:hypothetical protein
MAEDAGSIYSEVRLKLDNLSADIMTASKKLDGLADALEKQTQKAGNAIDKNITEEVKKSTSKAALLGGAYTAAFTSLIGVAKKAASAVIEFGKESIAAYQSQAASNARLGAVIQATGAAAWTSQKQLMQLADQQEKATGQDSEAIQNMYSVMLGFKNITGDTFTRTTKDLEDMAAVMGGDLASAANQFGRALDDPINGYTSLTRYGFEFSQSEVQQIKEMQQSGDLMGAQNILLTSMEQAFNGAANAVNNATKTQNDYNNALDDFKKAAGEEFNHAVEPYQQFLTRTLNKLTENINKVNDLTDAIDRLNAHSGKNGKLNNLSDIKNNINDYQTVIDAIEKVRTQFGNVSMDIIKQAAIINKNINGENGIANTIEQGANEFGDVLTGSIFESKNYKVADKIAKIFTPEQFSGIISMTGNMKDLNTILNAYNLLLSSSKQKEAELNAEQAKTGANEKKSSSLSSTSSAKQAVDYASQLDQYMANYHKQLLQNQATENTNLKTQKASVAVEQKKTDDYQAANNAYGNIYVAQKLIIEEMAKMSDAQKKTTDGAKRYADLQAASAEAAKDLATIQPKTGSTEKPEDIQKRLDLTAQYKEQVIEANAAYAVSDKSLDAQITHMQTLKSAATEYASGLKGISLANGYDEKSETNWVAAFGDANKDMKSDTDQLNVLLAEQQKSADLEKQKQAVLSMNATTTDGISDATKALEDIQLKYNTALVDANNAKVKAKALGESESDAELERQQAIAAAGEEALTSIQALPQQYQVTNEELAQGTDLWNHYVDNTKSALTQVNALKDSLKTMPQVSLTGNALGGAPQQTNMAISQQLDKYTTAEAQANAEMQANIALTGDSEDATKKANAVKINASKSELNNLELIRQQIVATGQDTSGIDSIIQTVASRVKDLGGTVSNADFSGIADGIANDFESVGDDLSNLNYNMTTTGKKVTGVAGAISTGVGQGISKISNDIASGKGAMAAIADAAVAAGQTVEAAMNAILQATQEDIQNQISAVDTTLQEEKDAIEKSRQEALSEANFQDPNSDAQYDEQIAAAKESGDEILEYQTERKKQEFDINKKYDAQSAAADKAAAKQKAMLQYESDLASWQQSKINAAINTAEAVVNALATTKPFLAGVAMASVAGAMGGAEEAIIAMNPPAKPAFATGGIVPGSQYTGDQVIARLNSGEGVLTQQGVQNAAATVAAADSASQQITQITVVMQLDGTQIAQTTAQVFGSGIVTIPARGVRTR